MERLSSYHKFAPPNSVNNRHTGCGTPPTNGRLLPTIHHVSERSQSPCGVRASSLSNPPSYLARIWPNLENNSFGEAESYDAELRGNRLRRRYRRGAFLCGKTRNAGAMSPLSRRAAFMSTAPSAQCQHIIRRCQQKRQASSGKVVCKPKPSMQLLPGRTMPRLSRCARAPSTYVPDKH